MTHVRSNDHLGTLCDVLSENDSVEATLVPLTKQDLKSFRYNFISRIGQDMTDSHPWLGVFTTIERSTFTRFQRLTVAFTVLFLTFITGMMVYSGGNPSVDDSLENEMVTNPNDTYVDPIVEEAERQAALDGDTEQDVIFQIGEFKVTVSLLVKSLITTGIVLPPSALVTYFFKAAKPKNGSNSLTDLVKEYHEDEDIIFDPDEDMLDMHATHSKVNYKLPWWCLIIAYIISYSAMLTSGAFIFMYGVQWGPDKTTQWLVSSIISFGSSTFLVEPMKVFFLTAVMSYFCARLADHNAFIDDASADKLYEEWILAEPEDEEELTTFEQEKKAKLEKYASEPPTKEEISKAKARRDNNKQIKQKIWDIAIYTFWVALVVSLSYVNSGGSNRFRIFNSIKDQFDGYVDAQNFNNELGWRNETSYLYKDIDNYEKFWLWFEKVGIPAIYAGSWYNGDKITWNEQRFLSDRANFVIGVPYLYQVRSGRHESFGAFDVSLEEEIGGKNSFSVTNETYSTISYDGSWSPEKIINSTRLEARLEQIVNTKRYSALMELQPWIHLPAVNISGQKFKGKQDTYSGGGYGIQLGNKMDKTVKLMNYLKENTWVDKDTRAIFLEFTVFNPAWNLMVSCMYFIEYPTIGAGLPYFYIKPFRFYELAQDSGYINIALFGIFTLVTLIDIWRLVLELKALGFKKFIKRFWNLVAIISIFFSAAAVAMYVKKILDADEIVARIQADPHHYNFIGLRDFSALNGHFIMCLSFVTYFSIMRYIKLLNFNVRVKALASTIKISLRNLSSLAFMMFLYLNAFASLSWLFFNRYDENFKTFVYTWMHLFEVFLGKFDYTKVDVTVDFWMRIFYVVYSMVAVFILLNMVVAVLDTSIHDAQEKYKDQKDKLAVMDFISQKIDSATIKIKKEDKITQNIKHAEDYISSSVEVLELRVRDLNRIVDQIVDEVYEEELMNEEFDVNDKFEDWGEF